MNRKTDIQVILNCRKNFPPRLKRTLTQAAQVALKTIPNRVLLKMTAGKPVGHISVAIVGPKTIQKLNSAYRNKNKPTDVLSFSRMESSVFFVSPEAKDLGDVLICWDIAKKQAKEYQTSIEEELARLTVHGVLHLFGYDHEISLIEEKKMFRLQEKALKNLF
jgi:probable rRNA maturation factor